ncbi:phycobilisome rod-core linker polypeptide [Leptolyngbya sp. FACHB-261]|uniref:phycobilisome rod-core linker polypeptide n=1 Tax=Leptolyngbya sp. FACHB-261 TaxID=2692806 RepID=UPI00168951BD|nr:phycobilisome rod-core linker polypeptide [Leptolyngbya sp. FACHB-261]MBD2104511.1 phycobilisome rod-core linker polypeptide [Leptolyngbya sp. FACHB-261]
MALPLLETKPRSQNYRVPGYEVADEDDPKVYRLSDATEDDVQALIWVAYRQIFSEHLILESYRQKFLESQLKNRKISVREFIRGLGKSEVYRQLVMETNSNYRLVDISFKRFLGRATHDQGEQIAQSIVIANQGLGGFIDSLVDSEEYLQAFGEDAVPYQRRRFEGRPFNLVNPRYSDYWRNRQIELDLVGRSFYKVRRYSADDLDKTVIRQAIPLTFLKMAESLSPGQVNYQSTLAKAKSAKRTEIPDMTRSGQPPARLTRGEVALPYRYLPNS